MDSLTPHPPPRLRLSRHSPSSIHDFSNVSLSSSQSGPSRLPELSRLIDVNLGGATTLMPDDDDEDQYPTPKMTSPPTLLSSPVDTPAARLRALLSRVPNRSKSPVITQESHPRSPSDLDSDFDPPDSVSATPSLARDSVKNIFSWALRDPGGTPQKERRRNSFDVSEADASPEVNKERTVNRGKRKSLSDDEIENHPRSSYRNPSSFKASTQPLTLDILRERFTNSQEQSSIHSPIASQRQRNATHETVAFPHYQPSSRTTSPTTMTVPQPSLVMSVSSSQLQQHSNLLDDDSEMNRVIDGFEESEHYNDGKDPVSPNNVGARPAGNHGSESLTASSSSNNSQGQATLQRSRTRSSLSFTKSGRFENGKSSTSHTLEDRDRSNEQEQNNSTNSVRSNLRHSPSVPQISAQKSHSLSRRGSSASIMSTDDLSSKGSSFGSQAEYRERLRELERERNIEREREWNKPKSKVTRPSSALSMLSPAHGDRTRTQSFTRNPRPDSAQSQNSTDHALRRHSSFNSGRSSVSSIGSSSRASQEDEGPVDIVHERERNWNAPHPKWHLPSKQQPDTPTSPSASRLSTSFGNPKSEVRPRADSLKMKGAARLSHLSPDKRSSNSNMSHNERPMSPSPVQSSSQQGSLKPTFSSPRRSKLPHSSPSTTTCNALKSRKSLSPTRQEESLHRNGHASHSRIPLPSPTPDGGTLNRRSAFPTTGSKAIILDKNIETTHRRIEGIGFNTNHNHLEVNRSNNADSLSQDKTPTLRTVLPPPDVQHSPTESDKSSDEARLPDALLFPLTAEARPAQLPPLPPLEATSTTSYITETPSRPVSLSNSKVESPSPSSPQGLPELPEPSLSSESENESEGTHELPFTPANGRKLRVSSNWTAMKTPKPPGAWMSTPKESDVQLTPSGHDVDLKPTNIYATPAPSFSRATTPLIAPTPGLPGAWTATPSVRKSTLKVRFDPEPPSQSSGVKSENVPIDVRNELSHDNTDTPDNYSGPQTTSESESPAPNHFEPEERPKTPDLKTPITPARSPRSPRKSPGIRVLDAFGREETLDPSKDEKHTNDTPRNNGSVRIVDAMGRKIKESEEKSVPRERGEILAQVKKGLYEMVHEMDEDIYRTDDGFLDMDRVQQLESASQAARQNREMLSQSLHENGLQLQRHQKQVLYNKDADIAQITLHSRTGRLLRAFQTNRGLFFAAVFLQVLLIFAIYRVTCMRAKDLFLTTYYDPFYPDIHLYTTNPYMYHHSTWTSWFSIPELLRREGWLLTSERVLRNMNIIVQSMQLRLWNMLDSGVVEHSVAWPPT